MKNFKSHSFPIAELQVCGLTVLSNIDNQSSIDSSLTQYKILPEIREVSMDLFTYTPPYSVSEFKRVEKLSKLINESKTISPLIIVEDSKGFYILEGGHRFDALNLLKITSFPALVVQDLLN